MSLLQSIFGDVTAGDKKSKKKNAALASLFDKSKTEEKDEAANSSSSSDSDDDSSSSSSSSSSNEDEKKEKETEPLEEKAEEKTTSAKEDKKKSTSKDDKQSIDQEEGDKEMENSTPMESEEERTIFVGNLPLSTTRKSLFKLFQPLGKVQSARIRSVAVTGVKVAPNYAGNQNLVKKVCTNTQQLDTDAKSSVQGYVVFADKASVPLAIEQFNNKPLTDTSPKATRAIRRIRVDTAAPTLDAKRSVFVGNLPYQADEATLQDHFVRGCGLEIGQVQGVRIIRDKETFQCKGFGYVLFQDATIVATALQKMHESTYMRRPLRVKVCGKSLKGRRGQPKQNNNNKRSRPAYEAPNKKQRVEEAAGAIKRAQEAAGAMRRVAGKKNNKRVRGEKKKGKPGANKPGVSKRAASDAKAEKRAKKIQKRISKGMGKTRKS